IFVEMYRFCELIKLKMVKNCLGRSKCMLSVWIILRTETFILLWKNTTKIAKEQTDLAVEYHQSLHILFLLGDGSSKTASMFQENDPWQIFLGIKEVRKMGKYHMKITNHAQCLFCVLAV
ncbi:hypothetical protein ACJX0J_040111, partial [Zea mays]